MKPFQKTLAQSKFKCTIAVVLHIGLGSGRAAHHPGMAFISAIGSASRSANALGIARV